MHLQLLQQKYVFDSIVYCQLKPTTIQDTIDAMYIGVSPLKQGHPEKIPPLYATVLATHSTMRQTMATDGKTSRMNMIPHIKSITYRTIWEGKFSAEYSLRKVCRNHPEHFVLSKAKNHEHRRAEWLTVKNIKDWTEKHKNFLLIIKFGKKGTRIDLSIF